MSAAGVISHTFSKPEHLMGADYVDSLLDPQSRCGGCVLRKNVELRLPSVTVEAAEADNRD
jgi:hypothetical protein